MQSDADLTLKEIWFRHPSNAEVNRLMRDGATLMQSTSRSGTSSALERFRAAVALDPTFPEAHNKVATCLYLLLRCVLWQIMAYYITSTLLVL
jgi:hypothetical protein